MLNYKMHLVKFQIFSSTSFLEKLTLSRQPREEATSCRLVCRLSSCHSSSETPRREGQLQDMAVAFQLSVAPVLIVRTLIGRDCNAEDGGGGAEGNLLMSA